MGRIHEAEEGMAKIHDYLNGQLFPFFIALYQVHLPLVLMKVLILIIFPFVVT